MLKHKIQFSGLFPYCHHRRHQGRNFFVSAEYIRHAPSSSDALFSIKKYFLIIYIADQVGSDVNSVKNRYS